MYPTAVSGPSLIIGRNTTQRLQKYKGLRRAIAFLFQLQPLAFVDYVSRWKKVTLLKEGNIIYPSVDLKGSEYSSNDIESPLLKNLGAQLHLKKLKPAISTLIKTISSP